MNQVIEPGTNEPGAGGVAHGRETVTITYNGGDKELAYQPHEAVNAVLNRAMNEFDINSNRHLMALFTEAGVELPLDVSVEDAGVTPGQVLVLRQSLVRGGAA